MNKTIFKIITVSFFLISSCSKIKRAGSGFDFVQLNLENLSVLANSSNLINNFESNVATYNIDLDSQVSSVNLSAIANKIDANILVSSNKNQSTCSAVKTLEDCTIPIGYSSNKITIKLTQNEKSSTYTLNINRELPSSLASNIELHGFAQENYNLNFDSLTFNYSITLSPNENDIYLVVEPEASSSVLQVNNIVKTCSVSSPCQIPMIDVSATLNIKIITSQGNSSTYILTINKDLSAYLEDLKLFVNSVNILSNFTYDNTLYNSINMSPLYNNLVVSLNKRSGTQISIYKNGVYYTNSGTISGEYINYNIAVNEDYINLEIKSASSTFTVTYTLNINRLVNTTLSDVQYQINGAGAFLSFTFNSTNNEYSKVFANGSITNANLPVKMLSVFPNGYISIKEHANAFYINSGNSPYTFNTNISNILANGGDVFYDIMVKATQSSTTFSEYVLKITVLPPAQADNPLLSSLIIKNSSMQIIPTQPQFHYAIKNYTMIGDPKYTSYKISATALSSNDNVKIYLNNSLLPCTSTLGVINQCSLTNVDNEDLIEIKVTSSTKITVYKVNVNGYLIFENTNPDMHANNPDLYDAFGDYMTSKEITIGTTKYNYLIIGNPLKNKVYVYRASVSSNGTYTNFQTLITLSPTDIANPSNVILSISGFGEALAINNNFIIVGAPETAISYSSVYYHSNAGILFSYKIDQNNGTVTPHQIIVPSSDPEQSMPFRGLLLGNDHGFGIKVDINSDNKLFVSGNLNFNKNLYVFSNENNNGTNKWILSSHDISFGLKKLQIIDTGSSSNNRKITNVVISTNLVSACYHTSGTLSDKCFIYRYSEYNNEYTEENSYIENGTLGTGLSMDILETSDFSAVFIGEPYYDNFKGKLTAMVNLENTWYTFDIDEGDAEEEFMSNSISVISKTIQDVSKHFILVSSPNTGAKSKVGKFSIYEIYKQGDNIEFNEYYEQISANELSEYYDDQLTYNSSATNNFIIMSAPMFDRGTNINSNEGAMFIFKTDTYISDSIYNYVKNISGNNNIE